MIGKIGPTFTVSKRCLLVNKHLTPVNKSFFLSKQEKREYRSSDLVICLLFFPMNITSS